MYSTAYCTPHQDWQKSSDNIGLHIMQLVLGIKDLFGGSSDAPEMSPCRKVCALCACQGRISSNSRTRNLIIFDTINVRCGACGIIEYDFFRCLFIHINIHFPHFAF